MNRYELPKVSDSVYYVACPYTSDDPYILQRRYLDAIACGAELQRRGYITIEPIAQSHQQAERFGMPPEWAFWERRDSALIKRCDAVIVLTIDGWRSSHGVQAEIALAEILHMPIYYIDPLTLLGLK